MKKQKARRPSQRSGQKRGGDSFFLKRFTSVLTLLLLVAMGAGGYYFFQTFKTPTPAPQKINAPSQNASTDALMQKMKQMLEEEKVRLASLPNVPKEEAPVLQETLPLKNDTNKSVVLETTYEENATALAKEEDLKTHDLKTHELSEVHEYKSSLKDEVKKGSVKAKPVIRKRYAEGTTPKLAIIIDDVAFAWQTRMIKEIPYKVTPAFFPPTSNHKETVRLSKEFSFAMVHLPLEAKYFSRPEEDTLKVADSYETIEKRIKRIKEWFPHIVYYNNHTGGYFTSHYEAMDKLIKAMKEQGLRFVDSRTVGNSKAVEVTSKHGMFLFSRDVFLDNSLGKSEIRAQLKLAVSKAHKYGYAIAIGHPHKNTLEVLRDSKDLLQGVDLVYLNEL